MRRAFFRVAGVLALSAAGLLLAFGLTPRSSAQAPPPIPGASPKPSPVWNVQPGQVRAYVWVWWYDASGRRVAGKPVKIFDWRGQKVVGWQSAHSEHWRELRLKPDTKVCVKAFVKNAKTTPSCQVVTGAVRGQQMVFTVRVGAKAPTPTPTSPKPPTPPTPPTPPPPPTVPSLVPVWVKLICTQGVKVGLVATWDGQRVEKTLTCSVLEEVVRVPPGTTVTVCIQWPLGTTFVATGGPCFSFRVDRVIVRLELEVRFVVVVVTTTTTPSPPPGTTTVVTVTTGTTTTGGPVDPHK